MITGVKYIKKRYFILYIVLFLGAIILNLVFGEVDFSHYDFFEFDIVTVLYASPFVIQIINLIKLVKFIMNKDNKSDELSTKLYLVFDMMLILLFRLISKSLVITYLGSFAFCAFLYFLIPYGAGYFVLDDERIEALKAEHGDAWKSYYTDTPLSPFNKLKEKSIGHESVVINTRNRLLKNVSLYLIAFMICYVVLALRG